MKEKVYCLKCIFYKHGAVSNVQTERCAAHTTTRSTPLWFYHTYGDCWELNAKNDCSSYSAIPETVPGFFTRLKNWVLDKLFAWGL